MTLAPYLLNYRSSVRSSWLAGAMLLCLLCIVPSARAKNTCLTDPACRELIERGRSQSKVEKYDTSLAAYRDAYDQWPEPWLLVNIGRMQQKLGQLEEAKTSFSRYLDSPPASQDEKTRLRANEYLEEVEDELSKQKTAAKPPAPRPAPEPPPKVEVVRAAPIPIYKRWWFWTAIGVAVAGAAVGGGIAGYAHEPNIDGSRVVQPFGQ